MSADFDFYTPIRNCGILLALFALAVGIVAGICIGVYL